MARKKKRKEAPKLLSDRKGDRYGKLVVLGPGERTPRGKKKLWVRCDCGNEKLVYQQNLRAGKTKSCGCKQGARTDIEREEEADA